jgi:glycosyltransferase involved in cell wall biosynthesis
MISAVVLSHNDAATIERALTSLKWADEILLIDDNSDDDTVAVAQKLGVRVYTHTLAGDFASQRNFGLSKTKGDWVLYVDSDEVVSKELADEIQAKLLNDTSGVEGYVVRRTDTLWGRELRHGETANVRLLRLAKKNAGKWTRPVHEVWEVKGSVRELTHPLLHYPHPDVAQFLADIDRYSTINANYFYSQRIRASAWQIVAYPAAKFLINYIWRLGFLDGVPGAIVAVMMSMHSFLTRAKLYMLAW